MDDGAPQFQYAIGLLPRGRFTFRRWRWELWHGAVLRASGWRLSPRDAERALGGPGGEPLVFNLGLPDAGPLTELLVLRRLLRQGVRPDLLLIEVLAPVLAGQVELIEVSQLATDPQRLWHADLSLARGYLPGAPLRAGWWKAEAVPCHNQRRAMLSALAPNLLPLDRRLDAFQEIDDSGWTALEHVKKEDGRRCRAANAGRRSIVSSGESWCATHSGQQGWCGLHRG